MRFYPKHTINAWGKLVNTYTRDGFEKSLLALPRKGGINMTWDFIISAKNKYMKGKSIKILSLGLFLLLLFMLIFLDIYIVSFFFFDFCWHFFRNMDLVPFKI